MEKYYQIASSFDKLYPYNYQTPNCKTVNYVVHDYSTDPTLSQLNDSSEFELTVAFSSFFRTVNHTIF